MLHITEYAQEVAQKVNGEVQITEKANRVKATGIIIRTEESPIAPVIYIDNLYERGLSTDQAADEVLKVYAKHNNPSINLDMITDYEKVKPLLRARLYNSRTNAPVFKSAKEYGFADLIIIPYIANIMQTESGTGSIKITRELLAKWNVSADEVIETAEANSRQEATMRSMAEVMAEMMGADIMDIMEPELEEMKVVTNKDRAFGAYGVIPMLDELRKTYKEGFVILPSSVHEVIITPVRDGFDMDSLVQEVNAAEVDYEEQLSDHAYLIA